jgi:hypothetical protein
MNLNINKVVSKWSPILKNLGVVNEKLIEYISIYCENYVINNPNSDDLPERLKNILSKLSNRRIEIIKSYYNPVYGKFEYQLSNGLIVDEFHNYHNDLTIDDMILLFGVEFTRDLDVEKFREERLNNIING